MLIDVFFSYEELNEAYELTGERALSEDRNVEQLAFIVVIRKWRWDDIGTRGDPYLPFPGAELAAEVKIHDKADAFIYEST